MYYSQYDVCAVCSSHGNAPFLLIRYGLDGAGMGLYGYSAVTPVGKTWTGWDGIFLPRGEFYSVVTNLWDVTG